MEERHSVATFRERADDLRSRHRRFNRAFFVSAIVALPVFVLVLMRSVVAIVHVPSDVEVTFWSMGGVLAEYMDDSAFGRILSLAVLCYAIAFFAVSWLRHHAVPLGLTLSACDQVLCELRRPEGSRDGVVLALASATSSLMFAPPTRYATETARQWQLHSRLLLAAELGVLEREYVDDGLEETELRARIITATFRLLLDRWDHMTPDASPPQIERPRTIWRRTVAIAGLIAAAGPVLAAWNAGISSLAQ